MLWRNIVADLLDVKKGTTIEVFNPQIDADVADALVKAATNLRQFIIDNESSLRSYLMPIKRGFDNCTAMSAYLTNFIPDNLYVSGSDKVVYHFQIETWQKPFGYNDMYDLIFKTASNMHYLPLHFDSVYENVEHEFVLWLWKGDYWGLQGGAEIGLYCDFEGNEYNNLINHYHVAEMVLPMTLSLYEYKDDTSIENKFSWAPEENQWWITGFDSTFEEPEPDDMGVIGSIDFSEYKQLYKDLEKSYFNSSEINGNMEYSQYVDGKNALIFDDNSHTVWVVWRVTKSC